MSDVKTFDFEENPVRIIEIDGEPWFVAADVCRVLDLSNPSMALDGLDDDERAKFNLGRSSNGGGGESNIISESGLYILILRCRDAIKKGTVPYRFRKWVTAEVLPSIRKTGMYAEPGRIEHNKPELSNMPDRTVSQWINLIRETRLLYGRSAARNIWEQSPLPTPVRTANAPEPADTEFLPADGQACLQTILDAVYENGQIKRGCGVRPYSFYGKEYLFIANSHPFLINLFKGSIFDGGKYAKALLMTEGALRAPQCVRVGGQVRRGVLVMLTEAQKKNAA